MTQLEHLVYSETGIPPAQFVIIIQGWLDGKDKIISDLRSLLAEKEAELAELKRALTEFVQTYSSDTIDKVLEIKDKERDALIKEKKIAIKALRYYAYYDLDGQKAYKPHGAEAHEALIKLEQGNNPA